MDEEETDDVIERYMNNSGTPTVVVIPEGLYYRVDSPDDSVFGYEYNDQEINTGALLYKNSKVTASKKEFGGTEYSKGMYLVPVGTRLFYYSLGDLSMKDLADLYVGRGYKVYLITDNWVPSFI